MSASHPWMVACIAMSQAFSAADEASLGAIAVTSAARRSDFGLLGRPSAGRQITKRRRCWLAAFLACFTLSSQPGCKLRLQEPRSRNTMAAEGGFVTRTARSAPVQCNPRRGGLEQSQPQPSAPGSVEACGRLSKHPLNRTDSCAEPCHAVSAVPIEALVRATESSDFIRKWQEAYLKASLQCVNLVKQGHLLFFSRTCPRSSPAELRHASSSQQSPSRLAFACRDLQHTPGVR